MYDKILDVLEVIFDLAAQLLITGLLLLVTLSTVVAMFGIFCGFGFTHGFAVTFDYFIFHLPMWLMVACWTFYTRLLKD